MKDLMAYKASWIKVVALLQDAQVQLTALCKTSSDRDTFQKYLCLLQVDDSI